MMQMHAEVLPRGKGKHYATAVKITHPYGHGSSEIEVFVRGETPSAAEIAPYTLEQWNDNIVIEDAMGGMAPIQQADYIDWSHFQSVEELEVAEEIARRINGGGQ